MKLEGDSKSGSCDTANFEAKTSKNFPDESNNDSIYNFEELQRKILKDRYCLFLLLFAIDNIESS